MLLRSLCALLLVALLAACSSPQNQPTTTTVQGTVKLVDGALEMTPLAVALFIYDFSGMAPTAWTEVEPDMYLGPVAPLQADGTFVLDFADLPDMQANLLVPVQQSIEFTNSEPGCLLIASDPTAQATYVAMEGVTSPGLLVVTPSGLQLAYVTETELPDTYSLNDLLGAGIQGFTYVTKSTKLVTDPDTCASNVAVDLELTEGWNRLAFDVAMGDPVVFNLKNAESVPLFVTPPGIR